jgi:hypothetical protein
MDRVKVSETGRKTPFTVGKTAAEEFDADAGRGTCTHSQLTRAVDTEIFVALHRGFSLSSLS